MGSHNKRSKQKEAENKVQRAALFHKKPNSSSTHVGSSSPVSGTVATVAGYSAQYARDPRKRRAGHGSVSYLSPRTSTRINHPRLTYSNRYARTADAAGSVPKHTFDGPDPLDAQIFDYLIVVDVEATCERERDNFPHEIIELPAILIDVRRGVIDKARSFHTFVRPTRRPLLSSFCHELTGITQEQVDGAPTMSEAVRLFETWFCATIPLGAKVMLASDGPWDFKKFVYECHVHRDKVSFPTIFYEYIDIRTTFSTVFHHGRPMKLEPMLHALDMKFEGRPHCGFDDAYNIARLALQMMRVGCVFDFMVVIPLDPSGCYHTLPGYPLYRRAEGSGHVDGDVVDDIAKRCYGEAFFDFGRRHAEQTRLYRAQQQAAAAAAQQRGGCYNGSSTSKRARRARRQQQRDDNVARRAWRYARLLFVISVLVTVTVLVLWLLGVARMGVIYPVRDGGWWSSAVAFGRHVQDLVNRFRFASVA